MKMGLLEKLFSLKGKVALITGGYKGLGKLFTETYAEAGADIAIVARNVEGCQAEAKSVQETFGVRAIGRFIDVHDSNVVDDVVVEILNEFGKIDILVNCAGISGSEKPVVKTSDEEIDDVMNVDFRGTFLVSRKVAIEMAKLQSGRIVNVASIAGKIAMRNMVGYCASKAAVVQLTRVMALELMRDNIQVNVLSPGYFLTDLNREFFASEAGKKMIKKMIPIGRLGNLDELKSTILYLATCPSFLTGAEIIIDGGHTIA
ncbi:MAG: SDR family oxidoreductase [Deltaproteobacteria bacterium]|nr:SDR family oxidoreductase [Deltaproteobacteria bacterium]